MFFCRHRDSVAQAFRSDITYMPGKTAGQLGDAAVTFDPLTHSAQWSRRFIGLKLFMTLAERGEDGYAEMIEHQARMGDVLRERLAATGWRIVNSTPLPVICFTRDGLAPTELLAAMRDSQIAWMSEASIAGVPVIRACITSFKTTESDIESVVNGMNELFANQEQRTTASEGKTIHTNAH
jgi:glutamate/tyrosine decarboxylase-like PLP-dependent enzyme